MITPPGDLSTPVHLSVHRKVCKVHSDHFYCVLRNLASLIPMVHRGSNRIDFLSVNNTSNLGLRIAHIF